jgi:hypothetical protein
MMRICTNILGSRVPAKKAGGLVVAAGFLAAASGNLFSQTLLLSGADTPANGWRPIMASGGGYMTDPLNDSQTGQPVCEIVGTTASPAAYLGFGTIGGVQQIGFRVRLQELSANENNLKQATWFGFNFDGDASIDLWAGMDHVSQQSNQWQLVIANATNQNDNTANIGPSNAGMVYSTGGQATLPINAYAASNGTNYTYITSSASNTTLGTSYDLDGLGAADALLSWAVPFSAFSAAVNSAAVMGTNFGFTADTNFRVTVVTSNTQNTVNQDALGISGTSVSFVYSAPISSATPIPEPSTALVLGALLFPFAVRRRRRA